MPPSGCNLSQARIGRNVVSPPVQIRRITRGKWISFRTNCRHCRRGLIDFTPAIGVYKFLGERFYPLSLAHFILASLQKAWE